jgi:DUF1680 family protein
MAEVSNYMYSISEKGLYINMYGGNVLSTQLKDGSVLKLEQQTTYPWDGHIVITIKEASEKESPIFLRKPGWCHSLNLKINGFTPEVRWREENGYMVLQRKWKAGDKIELSLYMPVTLLESNPMVEETRNQVAVKRGPVVYCLESTDIKTNVFSIAIPASIKFSPQSFTIDKGNVMSLAGEARLIQNGNWHHTLYKEVNPKTQPVAIRLIPYYAWANRGQSDMTVWMPLIR